MNLKRALCALIICALALTASACDKKSAEEAASLSFLDAVDISAIQKLDGKRVTIMGYMATLSPLNGKYIYLMNLPYQSCPFCVPNSTQLANTMAVYAPDGATFDYTEQAIRVTGTLEMGDYTDDYGYVYNYRIADASYEIVDLSKVSDQYALWQTIAADGVVGELASMFGYLNFVCEWTEYIATTHNDDGTTTSYYLYPGDAENALQDDGPYGYAAYGVDGYFEDLAARIQAISATELSDLVKIIEDAQVLEQYALTQLADKKYTYDEIGDKYTLTDAQDLADQFTALYTRYSQWLGKWEI